MILVSVQTVGNNCQVSLTRNQKTIFLAKEINIERRASLSVFRIIIKGLLLLFKPIPYWQSKV